MGQTNDAKKQAGKTRKPSPRFNQAKFVQLELSTAELLFLKESGVTEAKVLADVDELVGKGYKVTVRHDERTGSTAAWLIAGDGDAENAGCILPARGSTAFKALRQLVYKHYQMLREDWSGNLEVLGIDALDD